MASPVTDQNPVARSLHEVGLGAWFGGSLMGAIGVNGAAAEVSDRRERTRVANAGWGRWMPVNALAIGAHLLGGAQLTLGQKQRIAAQKGVGTTAAVKAVLTAAAVGVTACSGYFGKKVMEAEDAYAESGGVSSESGTTPAAEAPSEVQDAQRKLKALQWAVPALTGSLLVLNAYMGEQERPASAARGVLERLKAD